MLFCWCYCFKFYYENTYFSRRLNIFRDQGGSMS
jgi:hypothetical protein